MPSFENFKPFIVTGLSLGGVYALSGTGIVVLYRATGVLNLAFGAVGAMGALISWALINHTGTPTVLAYVVCILFAAVVTLAYGVIFGPLLSRRDPLVKAVGTLGLALILLGLMDWFWPPKSRSMFLQTSNWYYQLGLVRVTWTQIIGVLAGVLVAGVTGVFLRYTNLGTAMRALANDREISATLGVPVRKVEAMAWLGSGLLSGAAGLLLSDLVALDAVTLTFLVISSLAAALIARLRSLPITLCAGLGIGLVTALITPILSISVYRDMTPFVIATIGLLWISRRRVVSVSRTAG
ncbi:MAG: branched-chain amino acid ABC transporter permease [Gaiellaceae bacterium]